MGAGRSGVAAVLGGGVACAHTPNIASQPSAHHCLKSTTKTNTNQYIGQIRPLENHKAHKSDKAPEVRLGLPDRPPIDLSRGETQSDFRRFVASN
jgi:hypothetical protein